MRKCPPFCCTFVRSALACGLFFTAQAGLFAQDQEATGRAEITQSTTGTTATKSSIVPKIGSKFTEPLLHKSVIDYTLPAALEDVAQKCAAGESDECYFSYKSFENAPDAALAAAANLELSVLSLQRGLPDQAIKYIDRAAQLNPEDPFTQLTKGWTLLSAGKYKKAREAFAHLFYLTADFEYVSSAKIGSAIAYYLGGNKEAAATELQYLYTSNPYTISFVSFLLGRISSEMSTSKRMAPVFLQQALTHDEKTYSAAKLLAELSQDNKSPLRAWQYYATLYSLDPQSPDLADKIAYYAKDFGSKAIDYLFYLRLEQPIAHQIPSKPSETVRMALYANREGQPVPLQSFSVMPSAAAQVADEKLGDVLKIPAYVEKALSFNPQTGGVDLKDAKGNVEFSARRPFLITPGGAGKTMVVKNLMAQNIFSADLSDKELSGALTVVPVQDGMILINSVRSEDLIPALLATQAQDVKEPAALTALSVVFRSALKEAVAQKQNQPYHITDNDPYFKFKGLNLVFSALLKASQASANIELTGQRLGYYADCGILSDREVKNTEQKQSYVFSPANVNKYVISNPPADLFSKPQDPTRWSAIKWMYLYEGEDIALRISYKQDIGRLRALEPLKRTPTGRVLSMRFVGSKGEYIASTPQEISFLLSAGTMRSNLFEALPLYTGKNIASVLVRGYDTGTGVGMCLHGADGLAKGGVDAMGIIKYYFPQARLIDTKTGIMH